MGILCYACFTPRAGPFQASWPKISTLGGEQHSWRRGHKAGPVLEGQPAHCCSGNWWLLGVTGGEGEFVGQPYNDDNNLGMLHLSAAPVSQLLVHTSGQGSQFTAQNYRAAPVQSPVLQDLAQVLCPAALRAVSSDKWRQQVPCLQQPAWCWCERGVHKNMLVLSSSGTTCTQPDHGPVPFLPCLSLLPCANLHPD